MNKSIAIVICGLALFVAIPALAKSHGQIVSGGSLSAQAATTPPEHMQALCDEIIASQNKSKVAMSDAGHLYFHGQLMGKKCVEVDYVKALTLTQQAGDMSEYNAFLKTIRERAASGNPLAVKALKTLHLSH